MDISQLPRPTRRSPLSFLRALFSSPIPPTPSPKSFFHRVFRRSPPRPHPQGSRTQQSFFDDDDDLVSPSRLADSGRSAYSTSRLSSAFAHTSPDLSSLVPSSCSIAEQRDTLRSDSRTDLVSDFAQIHVMSFQPLASSHPKRHPYSGFVPKFPSQNWYLPIPILRQPMVPLWPRRRFLIIPTLLLMAMLIRMLHNHPRIAHSLQRMILSVKMRLHLHRYLSLASPIRRPSLLPFGPTENHISTSWVPALCQCFPVGGHLIWNLPPPPPVF